MITQKGLAGSLESCDCLVMVTPSDRLEIYLESPVEKRFGEHIREVIRRTLAELGLTAGLVAVTDRGALDYCLRARVITAVRRARTC